MLDEMNFSQEDFRQSKWQDIISTTENKTCQNYSTSFLEAQRRAKEAGNVSLSQIYLLLHAVSFLWLKPEEKRQPFAPIFQWANGTRSIDISDFSDTHIEILKEIFNDIDDPELRSRIGDVIWTCQPRGNFRIAEDSISAYLKSGVSLLLTEQYYYGIERLTRAIHLSASLGKKSKKFSEVVALIEALIDQNGPSFSPFVGNLLELLYEYHQGDPGKNAAIAESFADFHQQRLEWYLSRDFWNIAARWHRLNGNIETEQNCLFKVAECYVVESLESQTNATNMHYSVAARHLQSAIEVLRRIPGTVQRRTELHRQMLELQAKTPDELGKISQEVDLTSFVEKAILKIQDKPFQEALFIFCLLGSSPKVESLRDSVKKLASDSPLLSWLSINKINEKGRTIGQRNSLFSGSPEEIESATLAEMHHWAQHEQIALAVVVNAVRLQLLQEHPLGIHDFLEITSNNPFVPPERNWIFARGFLEGFQGNFLEALHLLIPQVENSLRYLLNSQDVITSKLSSEGIQEEFDLNVLLEMTELKEIMGDDLIFDLKGTLTNRFGSNFRNLMAHGLLDQNEFGSYIAVYIWWLLLRICCLPLIDAQQQKEKNNSTIPDQQN